MSHNTFDDIVPPQRRSIRNISRTRNRREPPPAQPMDGGDIPPAPSRGRSGANFFSKYGIWLVGVAVFIILVIVFSLIFSGSKIIITPKEKEVSVSGVFTAVREPEMGELSYEIIRLEEEVSETVPASGKELVEERASGRIVIFNNFSTADQRLVPNTRFESPKGLIYKIRESVVVPGQEGNEDGTIVPGSIEVTVYADEPGETYNTGLIDFTIPGFKGSPQYEKFYARSQTPMTGGFVGERVSVTDSILDDTREKLEITLRDNITEKAKTSLPDGFHFFSTALFFEFTEPEIAEGNSTDEAKITLRSIGHGVLFEKEGLARHIAQKTIAGYDGEPVRLFSISGLTLEIPSDEFPRPWEEETFTFNLGGKTRVIWLFDEEQLKLDLSGRPKDALPTILSGYPGIDKIEVVLRPFWKQDFPDSPEDITVEIRLESD